MLKEKAWIVEQRDLGRTVAQIALEIGRSISTVYMVLADKTKVMSEWRKGSTPLARERFRGSRFPEIEVGLLEWFRDAILLPRPCHNPCSASTKGN